MLAKAVVARYPVVIADEHQDASTQHHSILVSLANGGARVRMFGDALQAILTFDETIPGWDELMTDIPVTTLSGAWRWKEEPLLGEWISAARARLRVGERVMLTGTPRQVRVVIIDNETRPWSRNPEVISTLQEFRDTPSLVVLGRRNDEVKEIARVADLALLVNEGSDQSSVEEVVAHVAGAGGDATTVAGSVVDFMIGCGRLDQTVATLVRDLRRGSGSQAVEGIVNAISAEPNLSGLVNATRLARRHAKALGWAMAHPMAIQAVAGLPMNVTADEIRDLIYRAGRAASEANVPARCASTIHKAKGREFDNVVVGSLDSSAFGPSLMDRQLLYVALSRARRQLTLIVPRSRPSPLIGL